MGRGRKRHGGATSYKLSKSMRTKILPSVLGAVMLIDLGIALILLRETIQAHDRGPFKTEHGGWSWQWKKQFEQFTFDILVLAVFRLIVFPLIALVGIRTGSTKPKKQPMLDTDERDMASSSAVSAYADLDGNDMGTPLLPVANGNKADAGAPRQTLMSFLCCGPGRRRCRVCKGEDAPSEQEWGSDQTIGDIQRADRNKIIAESVIFALSTALQIYAGIKAVEFNMEGLTFLHALLMILSVVCINVESVLCSMLIENNAVQSGTLREDLHAHPLFFSTKNSGHVCDLCRRRITKGYRCWVCDFDCCVECLNKKSRAEGEGGIRGDKGVRNEESTLKPSQYFRRALWLASSELLLLSFALLALILASVSNLFLPVYSGHVFNSIKEVAKNDFIHNIKIYVILSVASGMFGSVRSLCFRVVSRRLSYITRNKLFEGLIRQDIAFYDAAQTGDLISRLSWDCNAMLQPISSLMGTTLQSILFFFGGLVMSFVISWRLSMLAFTTMLPIIHLTSKYAVFSQRLNREIFTFIGTANSIAQEAMSNIRTVRAFSTEENEVGLYRAETKEALKRGVRDACANAGTIFLSNFIDYGASTLILLYGGFLVMSTDPHKNISIGMLYAYLRFWDMIQSSYQSLQGVLNSFTKAAGAAQRVLSLMDSLPDIDPNAGIVPAEDMSWSVTFQNVSFFYQMRPDVTVLHNINLRIEQQQVCALVGSSGCGKTTMISLILRYYDPTSGNIYIGNDRLQDFCLKELHKQVGYVSQETQMFAKTIEENIAYGVENYTQDELVAACKSANAHNFIMSFPSGYQTRIGERGVRLSGGQKQRIAIARMLLRKPRLLLLDEATSALDAESESLVQKSIDGLLTGGGKYTVVLVAHRLSTVVNANQICVVDKGVVTERGNHSELMSLSGIYSRLVSKQLEKSANMLYNGESKQGDQKDDNDNIDKLISDIKK